MSALSGTFIQAVAVARQNIAIQKAVSQTFVGFTIVDVGDSYRVYDSSAWDPPAQQPVLPWSPPAGRKVATVDEAGTVNMVIETVE